MKVERNRVGNKYTFTAEDKEDEKFLDRVNKKIDELEEENKKLKDDIKKWEDKRMLKLAEIYVMPTRELTTAIAKNEWFSSWYDTVKKKMLHELGFDRLDVQDLLKENEKLRKENEILKEYKSMYEGLC